MYMVYLIENHIQKNENYAQTQKKGQAFGKKETPQIPFAWYFDNFLKS